TGVSATAGNGQAAGTFDAAADNGAAVSLYTVVSSPGNHVGNGVSSPITVTRLGHGQSYTFTVEATHAAADGPFPPASTAAPPSPASPPPAAPAGVSALAGDGSAVVSFTPPASNGGTRVIRYTVTVSPGGSAVTGSEGPIVVTGLKNG